jgi:hypothetical protein
MFGVAWGLIMWIVQWRTFDLPPEISVTIGVVAATVAGLLFGLGMAAYYRWRAGRLGLPSWDEYAGS